MKNIAYGLIVSFMLISQDRAEALIPKDSDSVNVISTVTPESRLYGSSCTIYVLDAKEKELGRSECDRVVVTKHNQSFNIHFDDDSENNGVSVIVKRQFTDSDGSEKLAVLASYSRINGVMKYKPSESTGDCWINYNNDKVSYRVLCKSTHSKTGNSFILFLKK
jgi:RecB family endonuclease NucS